MSLLSPWTSSLRRFEAFLHREIPVEAVAAYRVGFGLLIAVEACTWLPYTRELFSSEGFHVPLWDLPAPSPLVARALTALLVLAAGCFAIGLFTRTANAVTLAIWTYLQALDQIDEKAIHSIVVVVLALLLFTPSGAALSLDALGRRRADRPRTHDAFVFRLIQFEFAQVYFFAGITKMTNPAWVSGSVLHHVVSSRWATDLGIWMSGWLPPLATRAGGLATILYELFAGLLLFLPAFRPWAIAAGVAFHLGIQSTLSIGFLGPHFLLALLVLFPEPEAVRAVVRRAARLGSLARITAS